MQKNASKTYKKIKHKTKRPKQFLNYIIGAPKHQRSRQMNHCNGCGKRLAMGRSCSDCERSNERARMRKLGIPFKRGAR